MFVWSHVAPNTTWHSSGNLGVLQCGADSQDIFQENVTFCLTGISSKLERCYSKQETIYKKIQADKQIKKR